MINTSIALFELINRKTLNYFNGLTQNPFATILMLHRSKKYNFNNLQYFEDMNIDPLVLKDKIIKYISDGYKFISLDDLLTILKEKKTNNHEKLLVITIDDGYIETYTDIFPILKNFNIPFTFYVASSFPNKNIGLWWNYLNDSLTKNSIITLFNNKKVDISTIQKKQNIYINLSRELLKMGNKIESNFVKIFNVEYDTIVNEYQNNFIGWDHINEMSKNTLCTIGSHTNKHFGLRFSTLEDISKDILINKDDIKKYTGNTPKHFAYPYGTYYSVGLREFKLIQDLGFSSGVNTFSTYIFPSDFKNRYSLPRVVLKND